MTISELIAGARERLRHADIPPDEASLDARLLAQHLLGWDTARMLTSGNDPESDGFADRYEVLVRRRVLREPVAYITGTREFWNLTFEVSPAVLIPRPETEGLVEAILEQFPTRDFPLNMVDVCTGSGCIAVAIASERPRAHVLATDLSESALAVARRNAARHGVSAQIDFVCADLMDGIAGTFDAVVSNPPYVPMGARRSLQPEVKDFEPGMALFGGPEGLDVTQRLVRQSLGHLNSGGYLMFEFGDGQENVIRELISGTVGLTMVDVKADLRGIPRAAIARRA